MNINLITLNTKGLVEFDGTPDFSCCQNDDIKDYKNMRVRGFIKDNGTSEYEVNLNITGTLILKSSVNGSDVLYDIDIKYDEFENNFVEKYKNSTNSLDILPIIWENILLEIPIRIANEKDTFSKTCGEGWEILE